LNGLKGKTAYWKMKQEALNRTLWRTRFGIGYGRVVRLQHEWLDIKLFSNACSRNCAGQNRAAHVVTVSYSDDGSFIPPKRWSIFTILHSASPRIKVTGSIFTRRDCLTQHEKQIYMFLLAGNLPCLTTDSCATFTGYNAALPQISFTPARSMYHSVHLLCQS
jgi:hypothetical protein